MELSWSRFETHRSPKGHGLRARARGRTVEAWQDASGRWRVRSTSAPQTTPDFRSWSEARQWAEKRITANPDPEHRPQAVHKQKNPRRKNREVQTDTGIYDTETWVELVDAETGEVEAEGTLEEVLATGKIRMPVEDVLERMSRRGFVDFRSSLLREASPQMNPKTHYGSKVELVDENDEVEWSGTLGQFFAGNEEIEPEPILLALKQGYEVGFGGGAAPMMVLRTADAANPRSTMANPKRKFQIGDRVAVRGTSVTGKVQHYGEYDDHLGDYRVKVRDDDGRGGTKTWNEKSLMRARSKPTNPSKVDAHKAHELRLFIDAEPKLSQFRHDADEYATQILKKQGHLTDANSDVIYGAIVGAAAKMMSAQGDPKVDKATRDYVARDLGEDAHWEYKADRDAAARGRNPGEMRVAKAWAISRSAGSSRGVNRWYKCFELERDDKPVGKWCGYVSHAPDRYLDFDTGAMWMENDTHRRAVEAAIWEWEATHETVGAGKSDKEKNPMTAKTNPRGKHLACGTSIGKKDCRQLQHVYTSQKKRGLSDERAAKSAWGLLRRNPALPFAVVKRFLAITNPAKGTKGEADTIAGDELELYIDNDQPLYRKWQAIVKNLWRHQAKGRYDHERAVDGFMYLVDDGAKKYNKEYGGDVPWNEIFTAPTRRYVANEYAKSFENNYRDEIQYAPPGAKHNPFIDADMDDWTDEESDERIYNPKTGPFETRKEADELLRDLVGRGHEGYVTGNSDRGWWVSWEYVSVESSRPAKRRNPAPRFDTLSTADQSKALSAYWKGLEAGATGHDTAWTGRMAPFAQAGMQDARVALGGARADNPTPPQAAWVVIDAGKPVGIFFAERPIDLAAANKVANGPGGRMRNGAGLGAFLGSLSGSIVGSVLAAVGSMPAMAAGGVLLAPLSLLLSAAGGAIGGHMGAPRDRQRRGAIGGGVGGLFGPLGAALGGYIGGRKPDKKRNPTTKYPAKKNACGCTHARARRLARNLCA